MNESDFESESVTAEIVPNNQLQILIQETNLEKQLADEFVINFEQHFKMASEWAKKAKKIVVTRDTQLIEMQEARTARLFLKEKRIEIEKFRVTRKEYYLKGGKAIDKVANFLKDMIIPIEEHLDRQEHFVELRKKADDERILAEAHAKQETDRIAKEQEDAKEKERLRVENEKLRKDSELKEKQFQKEREEQKNKLFKVEEELRLEHSAKLKAEADAIRKAGLLKKADDSVKLAKLFEDIKAIKLPDGLKSKESNIAVNSVNNLLKQIEDILKLVIKEEEI